MISKSGMISVPLRDKNDKLTGKIKCISWNDYKNCGHLMDERYTFVQENTVKVVNGNATILK